MNQAQRAFVEVKTSANPEGVLQRYWLNEPMTLIGRLEANQPGLHLNDEHISRQHAQLICQTNPDEQGYWLQNLRGKGLVRIYEHILKPGDRPVRLRHGCTFQIPALISAGNPTQFSLTFYEDDKQTACLAFEICEPGLIRCFGTPINLPPQEFILLSTLYKRRNQICPYDDVIAAIWPTSANCLDDRHAERRRALDVVLSEVRSKLHAASGGFNLIETIRGFGLCLRDGGFSAFPRDF